MSSWRTNLWITLKRRLRNAKIFLLEFDISPIICFKNHDVSGSFWSASATLKVDLNGYAPCSTQIILHLIAKQECFQGICLPLSVVCVGDRGPHLDLLGYQRFGRTCRLHLQAIRSLETLVSSYKSRWRCSPGDQQTPNPYVLNIHKILCHSKPDNSAAEISLNNARINRGDTFVC